MFSEILHGLIGRTQQEAGICENDPSAALQPCSLHIGIIPAGSITFNRSCQKTECSTIHPGFTYRRFHRLCVLRHSGSDWPCHVSVTHRHWWGKTSLLAISHHNPLVKVLSGFPCVAEHPQSNLCPKKCLAGDSQPLDVCSVHQALTHRYSVSLLGYGFYGDVLAESEKHRWMGPLRYDFSGTACWSKQSLWLGWNVTGDICPVHLFFPRQSLFLCLGTMVYLCNRSYAGVVQYIPADPVLSSPRDRTRCLSG